jgi:arylsulfatase A-like enzyme
MTLPSHSSLLTGLDPRTHGVRDNSGFRLAAETPTLAAVFHDAGYATAAFVGALPLDSQFGLDRGFDHYDDTLPRAEQVLADTAMPERRAGEVVDAALAWLRARETDERWFVWIHVFDPHFPYEPPAPFEASSLAERYGGEVMYVDRELGRLFDFVGRGTTEDEVLIVLTADHGESLGEHGERSHGVFAYDSTLRVPLLFSPFEPRTVKQRVRLIDVAPTILALQGLAFARPIDGTSLSGLVEGTRGEGPAASSYFEALSMYLNMQWAPLRGFYAEHFKYIALPVPELYDLETDPAETQNLCRDPATCERWAARFADFAGPFEPLTQRERVDPELQAQLEALGYVAGGETASAETFGPNDDP